ncbi:unnamed protein product [Kuraishia capsulata CBS 1993]|uniref:Needs CLA4 to survive protein 3 n=1 Tax=Kuraishia capsulata CBS 1993 TaxID=1382522 RepID=W6MHC0_9ASCO|nr:uncharacterized protein KUCA_T00001010001 [Kuraishia capsulata CBS 1993]CDK25043.1 unnamed protein product [Kuraishia capsulata CBS 1993]
MREKSINDLAKELELLKLENRRLSELIATPTVTSRETSQETTPDLDLPLSLDEYKRYGRQMIVPQLRLNGQLKLKSAKILVVGAGGLGCPALYYLCGAGVGTIGIVDHDTVDISNLHRQILHSNKTVGMLKCDSAQKKLNELNPLVIIITHPVAIANDNVFEIMKDYDLVLDCTDTPATRYLVNDAAVILGKTIVSGSGVKTEGQLSILNFSQTGPCYRCFYPSPPPPNSVTACSDGGVIGPIIGLVGTMMAIEAIKVVTGSYTVESFQPFLSLYSGYPQQSLRTFKMRGKSPKCAVCSTNATLTRDMVESGAIDYSAFCGKVDYNVVDQRTERITVSEYTSLETKGCLLDVRPKEQFEICSLPGSVSIPLAQLQRCHSEDLKGLYEPLYIVCRYGNDSQLAARELRNKFGFEKVKDLIGGLNAWSQEIDDTFPRY